MITKISPSHIGAMGLVGNKYKYTEDLLALESTNLLKGGPQSAVSGFLPIEEWDPFLAAYPDQRFAAFLRRGITWGFRIGFDPSSKLRTCSGNFKSIDVNRAAANRYISAEVAANKLKPVTLLEHVHTSPLGLIPKPHQPGKFRLIVDLSAPPNFSVNDGISPELCSMHYTSVNQAAELVKVCGPGALLAKLDLKSAYRMVPVHPADQPLLGIEWQGQKYIDLALPFGLRSAPKLFTAVADALAWAMYNQGIDLLLHYLDDFFFCSPASSAERCSQALSTATLLCHRLGMPIAPEKIEGPSTVITFLGITIDSNKMELRLPPAKLARLRRDLQWWLARHNASKRQLESLLGHLNHAASVVRSGRTFTRHLIQAVRKLRLPEQRTRLDSNCKSDIVWWDLFVQSWNGVSLLQNKSAGTVITSDASGSWGCGSFDNTSGQWFQLGWPDTWQAVNIAVKELLPIVLSAGLWGYGFKGTTVTFQSDNQAVVSALTTRSVRHPHLMHLLRCLFFFEEHFQFDHRATHIPGSINCAADALSRNKVDDFFSIYPQAIHQPTVIPQALVTLLTDASLQWTSPRWRSLFVDSLQAVSPHQQRSLIPLPNVGTSPFATRIASHLSHSPKEQSAYL